MSLIIVWSMRLYDDVYLAFLFIIGDDEYVLF